METNDDLNRLFQKFVDKTINEEELERFYTYVNNPSYSSQLKQCLQELWGYIELTEQTNPEDEVPGDSHPLQRRLRLIDELNKINNEFSRRINTIIINVLKGDYH